MTVMGTHFADAREIIESCPLVDDPITCPSRAFTASLEEMCTIGTNHRIGWELVTVTDHPVVADTSVRSVMEWRAVWSSGKLSPLRASQIASSLRENSSRVAMKHVRLPGSEVSDGDRIEAVDYLFDGVLSESLVRAIAFAVRSSVDVWILRAGLDEHFSIYCSPVRDEVSR